MAKHDGQELVRSMTVGGSQEELGTNRGRAAIAIVAGLAVLLLLLAGGRPTGSDGDCGRFVERTGEGFSVEASSWPPGDTCRLTSSSGTVERHVGFEAVDWLIVLGAALAVAALAFLLASAVASRSRRSARPAG